MIQKSYKKLTHSHTDSTGVQEEGEVKQQLNTAWTDVDIMEEVLENIYFGLNKTVVLKWHIRTS